MAPLPSATPIPSARSRWPSAAAKALEAGGGVVRARRGQMLGLVAALQAVIVAKQAHVKALAKLLGQHPYGGLFLGLPGAGVVTAAALLGEIGEDLDALPSAKTLQAVGGTAPVTIQSGKFWRHPGVPGAGTRATANSTRRSSRSRAAA